MISNVYSYYAAQYANKSNSRNDSHKPGDLKKIYNRMVDINRTSPLYKVDLSTDMQKLAIDIKENALELKDFSDILEDAASDKTVIKQKAESSNEKEVAARFIATEPREMELYTVEVEQLATPQRNLGYYLHPDASLLEPGEYSFDVKISDVTYELQFGVAADDTVRDIQERIHRLMNKSDIGLTSTILKDSMGNQALAITSEATGTYGKPTLFEVMDNTEVYRNRVVDKLGIGQVAAYPENAIYLLDGEEKTSPTNQVTIGKSVELKFQVASGEPVNISIVEDTDALMKDIENFMEGYNRMIDFAMASAEKFSGGGRLLSEFSRMTASYSGELKENGFTIAEDGKISIDESHRELFKDREHVTKVLERLEDFKKSVARKTDRLISNPVEYLDKKVVAYKDPSKSFNSPYNASTYAGIMFDSSY